MDAEARFRKSRLDHVKGCLDEGIRKVYDRLMDEVMACIVIEGGRRMEADEIEAVPFGEMVALLLNNRIGVAVSVHHHRLEETLRHLGYRFGKPDEDIQRVATPAETPP